MHVLGPRKNGKNLDCWIGVLASGENLSGSNFSSSDQSSGCNMNILIFTGVLTGNKNLPMLSSLVVILVM